MGAGLSAVIPAQAGLLTDGYRVIALALPLAFFLLLAAKVKTKMGT